MRWLTYSWCLMLVALFGLPTVTAQEARFASLSERLAQVEAELARYKSGDSCSASCDDVCDTGCSTPGIVFGAELTFLKPHQGEGRTEGYDYEAAPRIWLGWQTAGGLGLRARWWEMDTNTTNAASSIQDMHFMLVDLEVTDTFTLGSKWEGLLSGGVRIAEYREDYDRTGNNFIEQDSPIGLVLGVELHRPVNCNWNIFGIARTSALFSDSLSDGNGVINEDYTFYVTEAQLGAEYRRVLSGTTYLFARAAAETQFWTSVSADDNESVGLVGGAFSLGIAR